MAEGNVDITKLGDFKIPEVPEIPKIPETQDIPDIFLDIQSSNDISKVELNPPKDIDEILERFKGFLPEKVNLDGIEEKEIKRYLISKILREIFGNNNLPQEGKIIEGILLWGKKSVERIPSRRNIKYFLMEGYKITFSTPKTLEDVLQTIHLHFLEEKTRIRSGQPDFGSPRDDSITSLMDIYDKLRKIYEACNNILSEQSQKHKFILESPLQTLERYLQTLISLLNSLKGKLNMNERNKETINYYIHCLNKALLLLIRNVSKFTENASGENINVKKYEERFKREYGKGADLFKILLGYKEDGEYNMGILERIKRYLPRIKISTKEGEEETKKTSKQYIFDKFREHLERCKQKGKKNLNDLEEIKDREDGSILNIDDNYFTRKLQHLGIYVFMVKVNGEYRGVIIGFK